MTWEPLSTMGSPRENPPMQGAAGPQVMGRGLPILGTVLNRVVSTRWRITP